MRYHTAEPEFNTPVFGIVYSCDHPVYSVCTLFKDDERGLAIIQQRYDSLSKQTWWTDIDPWIANKLYLHKRFTELFNKWSGPPQNDIFPALTVRQAMWYLRMKPLKREPWETTFDYKPI